MSRYSVLVFIVLFMTKHQHALSSGELELADLSFMVGHWQGASDTDTFEEIWLAPKNGIMAGMFRWPSTGGRYVLELLTISAETEAIVYRFKHFDPDITPWEQERALTYRLNDVTDKCATFTGIDIPDGMPAVIQYCHAGSDTLVFRGGARDQPIESSTFRLEFKRY